MSVVFEKILPRGTQVVLLKNTIGIEKGSVVIAAGALGKASKMNRFYSPYVLKSNDNYGDFTMDPSNYKVVPLNMSPEDWL